MRAWWSLYQEEERSLAFTWYNPVTDLLFDFTTGFTFTFKLVSNGEYYFNKTTGFTNGAVSPNVVVNLTAAELAAVTPGIYLVLLTAHNTASNSDMIFLEEDPPIMEVKKTAILHT